jgi:hypothetical protein
VTSYRKICKIRSITKIIRKIMKNTFAIPNVHEAMCRAPIRRAIRPMTRKIIANVSSIYLLLSGYITISIDQEFFTRK